MAINFVVATSLRGEALGSLDNIDVVSLAMAAGDIARAYYNRKEYVYELKAGTIVWDDGATGEAPINAKYIQAKTGAFYWELIATPGYTPVNLVSNSEARTLGVTLDWEGSKYYVVSTVGPQVTIDSWATVDSRRVATCSGGIGEIGLGAVVQVGGTGLLHLVHAVTATSFTIDDVTVTGTTCYPCSIRSNTVGLSTTGLCCTNGYFHRSQGLPTFFNSRYGFIIEASSTFMPSCYVIRSRDSLVGETSNNTAWRDLQMFAGKTITFRADIYQDSGCEAYLEIICDKFTTVTSNASAANDNRIVTHEITVDVPADITNFRCNITTTTPTVGAKFYVSNLIVAETDTIFAEDVKPMPNDLIYMEINFGGGYIGDYYWATQSTANRFEVINVGQSVDYAISDGIKTMVGQIAISNNGTLANMSAPVTLGIGFLVAEHTAICFSTYAATSYTVRPKHDTLTIQGVYQGGVGTNDHTYASFVVTVSKVEFYTK